MQQLHLQQPQAGLLNWLEDRGVRHRWAANKIGYTPEYFSRVLNGRAPLTDKFRTLCESVLQVPADVWN